MTYLTTRSVYDKVSDQLPQAILSRDRGRWIATTSSSAFLEISHVSPQRSVGKFQHVLTLRDRKNDTTRDYNDPVVADGLEFDAYISIGKNETDRKFLERNVTDVLKKDYGYRFFIDDENLLPRLGNYWHQLGFVIMRFGRWRQP